MNAKYDKIINLPGSHKESFRLAYSMLFCDMNRLESFFSSGMKRKYAELCSFYLYVNIHDQKNIGDLISNFYLSVDDDAYCFIRLRKCNFY